MTTKKQEHRSRRPATATYVARQEKEGAEHFFTKIPLTLLSDDRDGITSYTLAVYAAIQSYATFGKTTGAHPNTEQLAMRAHCSVATVERERNRLKELGYVTWIPGSFKLRRGNEYTLFPSHRGDHLTPPEEMFPSHRGDGDPPTEGITSLPQREHRETGQRDQTEKGMRSMLDEINRLEVEEEDF